MLNISVSAMAMHTMLFLRDFQKQEKKLDLSFQGKFLYKSMIKKGTTHINPWLIHVIL